MAVAASASRPARKASPLWLVGYFVIVTIGELHLAPVGLALVSRARARARALADDGPVVRRDLPGRRARRLARRLLEQRWSKQHFFLMIARHRGRRGARLVMALNPLLRSVFDETVRV